MKLKILAEMGSSKALNARLRSLGLIPKAMDVHRRKRGRRREFYVPSSDPKCSPEILLIIIITYIDLLSVLHHLIHLKKIRFMTTF